MPVFLCLAIRILHSNYIFIISQRNRNDKIITIRLLRYPHVALLEGHNGLRLPHFCHTPVAGAQKRRPEQMLQPPG